MQPKHFNIQKQWFNKGKWNKGSSVAFAPSANKKIIKNSHSKGQVKGSKNKLSPFISKNASNIVKKIKKIIKIEVFRTYYSVNWLFLYDKEAFYTKKLMKTKTKVIIQPPKLKFHQLFFYITRKLSNLPALYSFTYSSVSMTRELSH